MKNYVEQKRIRPDILTKIVYLSVMVVMLFGIINIRIFGDKGAGYATGPIGLFYLFYVSFVFAAQKAVWAMVRLRARRSQFLNAQTNMERSFRIFAVLGMAFSLVLIVSGYFFSKYLFGSGRCFFHIIVTAICVALLSVQGAIRGYLQGIGYTKPVVLSDLLISSVTFVTGTALSAVLFKYGLKVNNLFHVDDLSAVYGSAGMMIGILLGTLTGFVQISISFYLRKREIAEIVKGSAPRYLDNKNDVLTSIRPILYLYISPVLMIIADEMQYIVHQKKIESEVDYLLNYGIYAGRVVAPVIMIAFISCAPFVKAWNRIMARVERDELESARHRFDSFFRHFNILAIPATVFTFVLADTIQVTLFGKSNALALSMMQAGAVMILLLSSAIYASWLLSHMGKSLLTVINLTVAWIVHIAGVFVFVIVMDKGLYGTLFAVMAAFLIYDLLSIGMLVKMLKLRPLPMKAVAATLLSSLIVGLVIFLINKLLIDIVGDILTLVICFVVYYGLYMALITISGALKSYELEHVPFGKLFGRLPTLGMQDNYYEE